MTGADDTDENVFRDDEDLLGPRPDATARSHGEAYRAVAAWQYSLPYRAGAA